MKKSNLFVGIGYVIFGITCLAVALLTDFRLEPILCGLAGGGIGPGCMMLYRYFYWTSPKHEKEYQEKWEKEQIELHDELKEKLRDKAGRYAYVLGLVIAAVFSFVFVVLGSLQIVEHGTMIATCLVGFVIFQYAAGIVIFRHLLKKYE